MSHRLALSLLLAFCVCFAALSAQAQENLLVNGGFEEIENGQFVGWRTDMWLFDPGISYLEPREGGIEGGICAMIENVGTNDARFVQTVAVTPDTLYLLSGWAKTAGLSPDAGGAGFSVLDVYLSFPQVYDTDGSWRYLECYFLTHAEQTSVDIAARLGFYGGDTVGKAWFDDVRLVPVDAAPSSAAVISLYENTFAAAPPAGNESASSWSSGQWTVLIACVLGVLLLLYKLLGKHFRSKKAPPQTQPFRLSGKTPSFSLKKKDWALMLCLTLVYAAAAYAGLGSAAAPQTVWQSTGAAESVRIDLGQASEFTMLYYGGINWREQSSFTVEFSDDGETFHTALPACVEDGNCFAWRYLTGAYYDENGDPYSWSEDPAVCYGRYVRISFEEPAISLMEIAFHDMEGNLLPIQAIQSADGRAENSYDPLLLIDEQDTVPAYPSYYNSMYFDEIYHARTAYEHIHGLKTYETTHPPLGKLLIALGIRLFGMTPFGWRFMGTLAGVLMVPAMYLMGKLLFGKTRYAFLAAFLMAFDMMHLGQTRLATIDSYAVLFIILMYLCMFRYLQMSFFRDGWRTLLPLGLSGLFMGLGCASKWICFYAGAGLAILFFWSLLRRALEFHAYKKAEDAEPEAETEAAEVRRFPVYCLGTLFACVAFFLVIPAAIYYASYIPYFVFEGGLTFQRFWNAQVSMFSYHSNLTATHPYQSPWYEWPLLLRPMWYYNGNYEAAGTVSTILGMGNPAVWWVGVPAFVYLLWRFVKPHLLLKGATDHRPAMLLLAAAAQFVPWMFVTRAIFIYHYFATLVFIMLSIVSLFERLEARYAKGASILQAVYMGIITLCFVGFYPFATGLSMSRAWADAMNWLKTLHLPGWSFGGWLRY